MAHLVGADGRVEAIEISPELAASAAKHLKGRANVAVSHRSGSEGTPPTSDVIYVSVGASSPLAIWHQALAPGRRLILPLTPGRSSGAMLLVTRSGASATFAARFVSRAEFLPCIGAQSETAAEALRIAFETRDRREVRSLRLGPPPGGESCWLPGEGWWLSTEAPGE